MALLARLLTIPEKGSPISSLPPNQPISSETQGFEKQGILSIELLLKGCIMLDKHEELEARLAEFPIVEYGFLKADEVEFTERIRTVCETECPQYGTSWACPPAVGTVAECEERCRAFSDFFVFTTMAEVDDIADMEADLATREGHEEIARQVREVFRGLYGDCLVLSTESCAACGECTYPRGLPCRHPDRMLPCVESHAIVVTELAERAGLSYFYDYNTVIWFSAVFYNEQ